MAAMLDELNIDKVLVYGISGGGPTTLIFAERHPNRCYGCMTEVAVTGNFRHPKFEELQKWYVGLSLTTPAGARFGKWMAQKSPAKNT